MLSDLGLKNDVIGRMLNRRIASIAVKLSEISLIGNGPGYEHRISEIERKYENKVKPGKCNRIYLCNLSRAEVIGGFM